MGEEGEMRRILELEFIIQMLTMLSGSNSTSTMTVQMRQEKKRNRKENHNSSFNKIYPRKWKPTSTTKPQ